MRSSAVLLKKESASVIAIPAARAPSMKTNKLRRELSSLEAAHGPTS